MTLDDIKALIEQAKNDPASVTDEKLGEATDALREIIAAQQAKRENGDRPTPEDIKTLTEVAAAKKAVDAEAKQRSDAAAKLEEDTTRLLAELTAEPAKDDATGTDADVDADVDTAPTADADQPGDADVVALPQGSTPRDLATVAASLNAFTELLKRSVIAQQGAPAGVAALPAGRTPGRIGQHAPQPAAGAPRDIVTTQVYVGPNATDGRAINSDLEVARAFHSQLRGAYQAAGFRGRMPVIHVDSTYPETRMLGADIEQNYQRIHAVTAPQALTAAGGICAPLETIYEVEVLGSTDRPIRDQALARFGVDRGGITYRPPTSAAAAINGAGVWTLEDDEAVDTESDAATKACYVVDCGMPEEAVIQAIYACLEFSNITARFDPETTAANIRQGLIAHARLGENELFKAIAAGSKLVAAGTQVVGAMRHSLVQLDQTLAYYRNRHRLDEAVPMTWVAPLWAKNMYRSDMALQMAAGDWMDALAMSDAILTRFFAERGVTPVWYLDGSVASATVNGVAIPRQTYDNVAAGAAVPAYPAKIDSLLYTTGSWLFLDGGQLDLGLVRDSELNSRNRYRQFSETFEGVADRGVESLRVVLDVNPTGGASGTVAVAVS